MHPIKTLFITPPLTQPNTPYPATAFLKGYFNTLGEESCQMDLGLEVILRIFSQEGLRNLFRLVEELPTLPDQNVARMLHLAPRYISTIESAIAFLQGESQTMAHRIASGDYLPQAARFEQLEDMEWAFGTMGTHDKARHFVTLYLEDITDLITTCIDPEFGFSRYAEQLGRCATSFTPLYERLQQPLNYVDTLMLDLLREAMEQQQPQLVAITLPFPGNLYSALRCGAYIQEYYPHVTVAMGGGFASTELRSLTDARFFDYTHYLLLDDGERPLTQLLAHLRGELAKSHLVRTFYREEGEVHYANHSDYPDLPPSAAGTPDYSDLPLNKYLSVIEMANPMHSLWSNGRWNKMMLAHGCYWGKCAFCDISLDYIQRYRPNTATQLVDRMEQLIATTGERGFHFVDEAAPPSLLKELALEILRRRLTVTWWTNIRFEKSYTYDLCLLLKESGCIAVSGGIEVASDRLLKLINKGVSVAQVSQVTNHFTSVGIMVHAYLMYGFPSQTTQEGIDSMEVVRQLFENGLIQSAFWHRFALTQHSGVGCNTAHYGVEIDEPPFGGFARNDLSFVDLRGDDPTPLGEGLRRSLYNYMRGVGFDLPLHTWFDTPVPPTQLPPNLVARYLEREEMPERNPKRTLLYWLSPPPRVRSYVRTRKGKQREMMEFTVELAQESVQFTTDVVAGNFLAEMLPQLSVLTTEPITLEAFTARYQEALSTKKLPTEAPFWEALCEAGLILV